MEKGEDIPDDPTPLSPGEEDIDDEKTPQGNLDDDLKKNNTVLYAGIGAVAVVAILLALFLAMKKKKVEE